MSKLTLKIGQKLDDKLSALPEKQRQWVWFVGLWCFGFFTILTIAKLIKWFMGV